MRFTPHYILPGGQKSSEILDSFQESLEDLALSLGANPVIFIGADLNIDIDAIDARPHDKAIYTRVMRMINDFALVDLFGNKHKSKTDFPGYTFYPNKIGSNVSRLDYLFTSKQFIVDMSLPSKTHPLQFSSIEIIDKAVIASDHNGIRWQIA